MVALKSNRTKPEITYPHVVRRGSIGIKVYRMEKRSRGTVYVVTYFRGGKRYRSTFRDEAKALHNAETAATAFDTGKVESLSLDGAELQTYRLAQRSLEKLQNPPPLHAAIEEYVTAAQLLGETPLLEVVKKHLAETECARLKPITVSALVEEFIASKQADGVSERYLQDCRSRLGRFGRDFKGQLAQVKTAEIDAWLRALRHSPRSRNNYRVLLVTMFRFARACGYLPRDRSTEADHTARAKDKGGVIEIYSAKEMQKLLNFADKHTLPFVALAGFAGLRSAEIERLTWDCIKWDQKLIEIKANMAKTAQRRLVPLSANLAACLAKWRNAQGPIVGPVKLFMRLEWLSAASGIEWKRNGLRHSYASYRLVVIKDAGKLALEMGNSPNMVFRHYRELVTPVEAKAWFALTPKENPDGAAADAFPASNS